MKEGPGGEAGAFKETSQSRDQGALDARILSQGTASNSLPRLAAATREAGSSCTTLRVRSRDLQAAPSTEIDGHMSRANEFRDRGAKD
jgi:hypothetical protein